MNNNLEKQKGFIALISLLIILAVTLLIAISTNLFGISELDMGVQGGQSAKAFSLASLCAEDALMKLKDDLNYSGNESFSVGEGGCDILSLEGSGNNDRIIKTIGNVSNQIRKIKIEVGEVDPKMKIISWREVVQF